MGLVSLVAIVFAVLPFQEPTPPEPQQVRFSFHQSSDEQIYVQPFPTSGGKRMVSTSGGQQPRWRGDGKELFYIAPDGNLMAVAVRANANSAHFEASVPRPLFQTSILPYSGSRHFFAYDVASDGRRFLINTFPEGAPQSANNV